MVQTICSSPTQINCPAHTQLWRAVLWRKMEILGRGTTASEARGRKVNTECFSFQLENL